MKSGAKGQRAEREIVELHLALNVFAERVPRSGADHYQGVDHDVDVYPFGREEAPLISEVKARKNGAGFKTIEGWLGENDALFLRRDRQRPLVVLSWEAWERLVRR